ncbi:MAG: hypothetical protein E7652_00795 [Ruminococcaceae bacterium]|nr:hypothetical protein [Oscillospiraceae bacterium]
MKIKSFISLVLALCLLLCACNINVKVEEKKEDKETRTKTETEQKAKEPEEEKKKKGDIVLSGENYTIDVPMLTFLYNSNLANYILPYAQYYGLSADAPLSEQTYMGTEQTWKEFVHEMTLTDAKNFLATAEHAKSVGHEFPELEERLDEQIDLWKGYADQVDMKFDDFLAHYYGEGITEEVLRDTFKLQFYVYSYNEVIVEEGLSEMPEDYYDTYFAENCDENTQTEPTKNVCHILIKSDSYPTDEEAKIKADEVLALYRAGELTREAFEALASQYNEDSNCYYGDIPKGQMVAEFENWIYDESRKVGDTDIVKTQYGYHVMYFAGSGEIAWKLEAKESYEQECLRTAIDGYVKEYEDSITVSEGTIDVLPDDIPTGYKG